MQLDNTSSVENKIQLLKEHPCFKKLGRDELEQLVLNAEEYHVSQNAILFNEGDVVDAFYLIIQGKVEIFLPGTRKGTHLPEAILVTGEIIGLSATGLYSKIGKRTATVIAKTNLILLKVSLEKFKIFLEGLHDTAEVKSFFSDLLRLDFLKRIAPFSHLSQEHLSWINRRIREIKFMQNEVIFHQGDRGKYCYFIVSGLVSIIVNNIEVARLESLSYFGEAALLSDLPRNATAIAVDDSEVLMLHQSDFLELMNADTEIASSIFSSQIFRGYPTHAPNVTAFAKIKPDQEKFIVLKNSTNGRYFQLAEEGWFIWQEINGENSLRDITVKMYKTLNIFNPEYVYQLLANLLVAGFILLPSAKLITADVTLPLWKRLFIKFSHLMQVSFIFKNNDQWLTRSYSLWVKYLYHPVMIKIYFLTIILGCFIFLLMIPSAKNFIENNNLYSIFLLALPFFYLTIILHELGHAYTTKHFGKEVHKVGVGWFWLGPVAFVDTSDMWIAPRSQRLKVNAAGIFVQIVLGSLAVIVALFIDNSFIKSALWLFCFSQYLGAFFNLCPLFELDGYYLLMDIINKPNLRQLSIAWLSEVFSHRSLFSYKKSRAEMLYWFFSFLYIGLAAGVIYFIQNSIFAPLLPSIFSSKFFWLLSIGFLLISIITIIIEVKHYKKTHLTGGGLL